MNDREFLTVASAGDKSNDGALQLAMRKITAHRTHLREVVVPVGKELPAL